MFKKVDCIRLFVSDLEQGREYYEKLLGLKMIWKTEKAIGLGMDEDVTEVVLHNSGRKLEVDFKVNSVLNAVKEIKKAGGRVIIGPFDIKIGKCAVVKDLWNNEYAIIDSTKGTFITDEEGNIIGQE
ncbi:MAG: VOC family protein [Kosmotoga sp.]|nr:MAG: VOC family protein [Kosmotoga sp.]